MAENLSRTHHRATRHAARRSQRRLLLESLEARHLMAAVNDAYSTSNSGLLNVAAGSGLTANDSPGSVVGGVNGSAANVGANTVLASGATLNVSSSGAFTYNPATSPTLSALAAGAQANDTFTYQTAALFSGALATWAFPVLGAAGTETGAGFAPTTTAAGLTASDVADTSNQIIIGIENPVNGAATYPTQPVLRVDPAGNAADATAAAANNKYFTFTVTPGAGNALNLSSLSFSVARGGAGTPRGWGLRSSVDGFGSYIATADAATARATFSTINVDLSAPQYQNLTTPITFRMYTYSTGAGATVEYDDITINGSVAETATATITVFGPKGVAYESFESYAAATQINTQTGGTGFAGPWTVTAARVAEVTVVDSNLSYSAGQLAINGGSKALRYTATEGTANPLASRPLPSQSGPLYLSLLYQNSVDPDNGADDFMQFGFDVTALANPNASIFDRITFNARALLSGNDAAVSSPATTPPGTTHFLVLRIDKISGSTNYNRVSIFVDPTTAAEPGTPSAVVSGVNTTLAAITQLAIRRAGQEAGDTYLMDEFRIGNSWGDVVLTVPDAPSDLIWDGGAGDGRWDNPVNWVGDTNFPDNLAETAIFRDAGAGSVDLNGGTFPVGAVRFQNSTASAFTFNNGTLAAGEIRQEGSGTTTLNLQLSAAVNAVTVNGGTLSLTNLTNALDAANTATVNAGVLLVSSLVNATALGGARVVLHGGELEFAAQMTTDVIPNALNHLGYHTPNATTDAAVLDLNNNVLTSLMGGGNPALGPDYVSGRGSILTHGPAGLRGLDFDNDADFQNTGAITNADNYSNLFIGVLHVSAANAGAWTFNQDADDDRIGIWVDIDGDGVFESSTAGLGDNRGEQVSWENGTTRTVTLAAGNHLVAFVHRELTGGSQIDVKIKSPTMTAEEPVRPASPNQQGFYSTLHPSFFANVSAVPSVAPLTFANPIEVLGNATIDTGNVPGVTLTGNVKIGGAAATTLTTIVPRSELRITDPDLTNNSTINSSSPFPTVIANLEDVGGTFTFTKAGSAVLQFVTANPNMDGAITVAGGTLLSFANGSLGTLAAGTTVNDGATLQIASTASYTDAEPLTLDGTLLAAGNVTYGGTITTSGNGGIIQHSNNPGGTLTIPNTVTLNQALTVQGDGSTAIDGQVTGTGNITKNNNGVLRLNNATNNFTGNITINAGTVSTPQLAGLGALTGVTTVNSGGTLELNGALGAPLAEPITINGNGVGNNGAIQSTGGDNTVTALAMGFSSASIGNNTANTTFTITSDLILAATSGLRVTGAGNTVLEGSVIDGIQTVAGRSFLAGLLGGTIGGTAISTAANPGNQGMRLSPHAGLSNAAPPWADNITWVYTGQFFDADGRFAFAESIDDRARIFIDGVLYLSNDTHNIATSTANATANAAFPAAGTPSINFGMGPNGDGWHNIEIRFHNGTGGAGATGTSPGWVVNKGFGLNANPPDGFNSILAADYIDSVTDPGDGTLWRVPVNPDAVASITKVGAGTLRIEGTANNYSGRVLVQAGEVVAAHDTALGTSVGDTHVSDRATLTLEGVSIASEDLVLNGSGAAGRSGVLVGRGDSDITGTITAEVANRGKIVIASDAGTLTVDGTIHLQFSGLVLSGSGNLNIQSDIDGIGGTQESPGGLTARFYNVAGAPAILDPATGANIGLEALTPTVTTITPRIDFGAGTDVLPGDGSVLDRGGTAANLLGGVGVSIGTDNIAGLWTGFLEVPETANFAFTIRNDDGARAWVDINGDGDFDDTNELVATDPATGGVANTTGATVSLTAGRHAIKVAWYEGGGDAGMQLSWAQTSGNTFARRNIEPSAFVTTFSSDNSITKNGSGTATLAGNNAYNGLTQVNTGTLVAAHNNALGDVAAPTNVAHNATLAFSGSVTIPENVNINGHASLETRGGNNTLSGNVNIVGQPVSGGPRYVALDIGAAGQNVETGYVGVGTVAHNTNGVNFPATAFTSDTNDNFTLTIDNVDQNNATVGAIDWRDRGDDGTPEPLSRVGEDFIKNNAGVIRVRLSDLPAGTYFVTSYHFDQSTTQSDQIRVHVNNGSGYVDTGAAGNAGFSSSIDGISTAIVSGTAANFSFTATGGDVLIVFDGRPSGDDETPLNGLVISAAAFDGHLNLNALTGATLNITGVVDDGANNFPVTKVGPGTVTLSAANTYDGVTTVNAGTLTAANDTALGPIAAGTIVNDTGRLMLAGNVTVAEPISTTGNATIGSSSGVNTLTSDVQLGPGALTIDVAPGAALVHTGAIVDGANSIVVTKVGLGAYVANGTNTFDGPLNHNAGFMFGNGSFTANLDAAANAILSAGGGYLNNAFDDFGLPITLSYPTGAPITGTLTTGSINLGPGSISTTDILNGSADRLVVNGTVSIAPGTAIGTGEIADGFTPTGIYVVVENDGIDPIVGEFVDLPNLPSGFVFTFDGLPAVLYYNYDAATGTFGTGNDLAIAFNRPPVANPDSFNGIEDGGTFTGNVLANDTDADNDALGTVELVGPSPAGAFTLNPDGTFSYTPAAHLAGTITFQYRMRDEFDLQSNTATVTFNITPVADQPNLTVTSPLVATEDTRVLLGISGALLDTDTSETLTFQITGAPAGASFLNAANQPIGTLNAGVWTFSSAEVSAGMFFLPPANSDADFTVLGAGAMTVTAIATDSPGGSVATRAATLEIVVNAVADQPNLTVTSPVSGSEDTAIALTIAGVLTDTDGSETLTYQIRVPAGASLSAGTYDAVNDVWTLTATQVTNLTLTPPANSDADFTVDVTAIATEGAGGSAQRSAAISIVLDPVADPPNLAVTSPVTTLEDTTVPLSIVGTLVDPGETLSYRITGVPAGARFSNSANVNVGTNQGGGTWSFTIAEINAGIRFTPPFNSDVDYTTANGNALTVVARSTDTGGVFAETSRQLQINVTAVADPPVIVVPATVTGSEYTYLSLGISGTLFDTDGSETMVLTIDGVPADADISTGTPDPVVPGRWIVSGDANITNAAIRKRDNNANNASFTLTVIGTATEADPNGSPRVIPSAPAPIIVTVLNTAPLPREEEVQISGIPQDTSDGFITVVPGLAVTYVVSTRDLAFPNQDAGDVGASVDGPFTFRFDFEPGKFIIVNDVMEEDELVSVTYAFGGLGNFRPTLTVTDKPDGTQLSTQIPLTRVNTVTQQLIDGTLFVGGGVLADRIIISPSGFGGIQVRMNNKLLPRQNVSEKVVVFGNAGGDTISSTGNILVPVEYYGGEGDDYLTGTTYGDTLDGGVGKDRLLGGGGHDTLLGGPGNDSLTGGDGNDYLGGDEYIDFLGGTDLPDGGVSEPGQVLVWAVGGNDLLNGDKGNDTLSGHAGVDNLNGGVGNDFIRGGDAGDRINGGDGNDLLLGDGGSDNIRGLQGRDILIGGTGLDQLFGGLSADLMYASDIDGFVLDDFGLSELWLAWQQAKSQDAHDMLFNAVVEDNSPDSVHGEQDDDWYLVYIKDRFLLASEAKSPHVTKLL